MKLKTGKIRGSFMALNQLSASKMPAVAAMKVSMAIKALKDPAQAYEETWDKLVQEFGVPIPEQEGKFSVPEEKRKEFMKEVEQLHEQEVDVQADTFSYILLGNAEVAPSVLLDLDWLITAA